MDIKKQKRKTPDDFFKSLESYEDFVYFVVDQYWHSF